MIDLIIWDVIGAMVKKQVDHETKKASGSKEI